MEELPKADISYKIWSVLFEKVVNKENILGIYGIIKIRIEEAV